MKKGLKKFLISAAVVLAVVVVADWAIGKVIDKMLPAISNQGQIGSTYYALNEVDYPVLVVGSSRAKHHYVPSIMQDSLGLEVYNIARNGCFFSYNSCVIQSVLDRYTPKMIIWETPMSALSDDHDPLESLYAYYGKNKYATEFINEDCKWTERVLLSSSLYKYNSELIRITTRYFQRNTFVQDELNGYIPIKPKEWIPEKNSTENESETINKIKVQRFRDILQRASQKGVRLVIVNSPSYMANGEVSESEKLMREMCDSMGVTILNFAQAEGIYDNIDLWGDFIHMNSNGAEMYTRKFLGEIAK